jgi:hypothetical protein
MARSFSEADLAEIVSYDGDVIDMEVTIVDSPGDSEHASTGDHTEGQSSLVRIYGVSCEAGASTSIEIPILAPDWQTRLTYTAANGARIGLTEILHLSEPRDPMKVIAARFAGVLPRGTREIGAFWWYGSMPERGPVYWTQIAHSC